MADFDQSTQQVDNQYNAGADIAFVTVSPEELKKLKLPRDYKEYVLLRIYSYDKQSSTMRVIHNLLQLIIFVGAATITVIVGIPEVPKIIPAILSGIITVATAVTGYYKFGEHSRNLYLTSESLALEYNKFDSKREPYKGLDTEEALALFMDRVETSMHELTQRSLALEKLKEEAK